jgi:hypothetical protein
LNKGAKKFFLIPIVIVYFWLFICLVGYK